MTTTSVKKFVHPDGPVAIVPDDTQLDETPYVPDETSKALTVASPVDVAPFDAQQFAENLKKVQMWTSYTGPVPKSLDDFINLDLVLTGMVIQHISDIDEESGLERKWIDIRFKTSEGEIIGGSGKAIRQFASLLSDQLGQGDWPISIKVKVRSRTLNGVTKDGKPKKMPTFEVLS